MKKKTCIYQRAITVANYVIETESTVRKTAKQFNISKTTVHEDLTKRLPKISPVLYTNYVKPILEQNKQERHIRGGEAKRKKHLLDKQKNNLY